MDQQLLSIKVVEVGCFRVPFDSFDYFMVLNPFKHSSYFIEFIVILVAIQALIAEIPLIDLFMRDLNRKG